MYTKRTPEAKELITTIAVKKLEIQKLEKELLELENQERADLCRRYGCA
jgi:hypothetical protein